MLSLRNLMNLKKNMTFKLANRTFYCFAVTAYNTSGLESGYSNEVCYTTPKPGKGNQK